MKSNFWLLYKTQMASMLWAGKKNNKKKSAKARSLTGQIVLWGFITVLMAFYEFTFCMTFQEEGSLSLFPPIVALLAMFLTLLTSISYTKVLLFEAKDHDMLFSLPLSGKTIVAAKIATMYTLDSFLNLAMLIPCGIIYGILARPNISFYIYFFIMMLFVSLIPILIASVISALINLIASRFRHAQVISIILSIAFFIGIMMVSMLPSLSAGKEEGAGMISPMLLGVLETVGKYYLPFHWYMNALTAGSLSSALLFVGVSLLAFAVVAVVFGKFYGKIHEIFRPRMIRRSYKAAEKSSNAMTALMKKDAKRLFSSANLFMNQLTGVLMLVVFAVIFSIQKFAAEDEILGEIFSIVFPFLFAMAASMVADTSTTISLEGKSFPLLKSLPIPTKTILQSKLNLHMLFCAPAIVICGLVVSFVNQLPIWGMIAMLVIPLCYSYMSGIAGLLINLKKYKFDWTSEIMIAKNSLPVMLIIFGGMILSILPMILAIVLYVLSQSLALVLGIFMTLVVICTIIMHLVMNAVGEKWFLQIEY